MVCMSFAMQLKQRFVPLSNLQVLLVQLDGHTCYELAFPQRRLKLM